jgi:tetratricopeptide (TPR) repeat protein
MWVDLARHYAILGLGKRAARSMDAALRLVPNNRFVLRSAARLYVHINDPERAHDLILRSASSKQDPWLIAAELATAAVADRTPRLVRSGRGIMASGGFPDSQISELASALATLELSSGNSRIARRLFREALLDPTDNTVAQAKWASSRLNDLGLEEKHFALPLSFEARAQEYYSVGSSIEALDECRKWFDDEPYSSRPPLFGSFVSAVILEDYLTSTEFAEVGLSANPNDPLLTNNLVFALASNGKTQNAQEIYDRMNEERFDDDVKIVWLATGGLLAFRKGDLASGRALYQKAIERASDSGKIDLRAMAAAFLAREELIAQTPLALRALEFASTAAEGSTNVALRIILLRLRSMQA